MDILKNQLGFSILETLVGLVILGIVIVLSFTIFSNFISSPITSLRQESAQLAIQEIDRVKNLKITYDTSYYNEKKNLLVKRKTTELGSLNKVNIIVYFAPGNKKLTELSILLKKNVSSNEFIR